MNGLLPRETVTPNPLRPERSSTIGAISRHAIKLTPGTDMMDTVVGAMSL